MKEPPDHLQFTKVKKARISMGLQGEEISGKDRDQVEKGGEGGGHEEGGGEIGAGSCQRGGHSAHHSKQGEEELKWEEEPFSHSQTPNNTAGVSPGAERSPSKHAAGGDQEGGLNTISSIFTQAETR